MIDNRTLISYGVACCFIMASLSLITSAIAENSSSQLTPKDPQHCYRMISQKVATWINTKVLPDTASLPTNYSDKLGVNESSQQTASLLQQTPAVNLIDTKIKSLLSYTHSEVA